MVAEMLAWMAAEGTAYQRAARLFGCAQRLRESVGGTFPETFRVEHERSASAATEALGAAAFAAAVDRGRTLTIDGIVADALAEKRPAPDPRPRLATTHVINMLNKLGLSSRIQLASWVTASQPAAAKNT